MGIRGDVDEPSLSVPGHATKVQSARLPHYGIKVLYAGTSGGVVSGGVCVSGDRCELSIPHLCDRQDTDWRAGGKRQHCMEMSN